MKYVIVFTLMVVCGGTASGWAVDFLHGEIEAVDEAGLSMTLCADQQTGNGQLIEVILTKEAVRQCAMAADQQLPGCIAVGRHVKVWGKRNQSDAASFRADEVRGCGMASGGDPTGVRSRLNHNRAGKSIGGICRE